MAYPLEYGTVSVTSVLRNGIQFVLEGLLRRGHRLDTITEHPASEHHDLNSSTD